MAEGEDAILHKAKPFNIQSDERALLRHQRANNFTLMLDSWSFTIIGRNKLLISAKDGIERYPK